VHAGRIDKHTSAQCLKHNVIGISQTSQRRDTSAALLRYIKHRHTVVLISTK